VTALLIVRDDLHTVRIFNAPEDINLAYAFCTQTDDPDGPLTRRDDWDHEIRYRETWDLALRLTDPTAEIDLVFTEGPERWHVDRFRIVPVFGVWSHPINVARTPGDELAITISGPDISWRNLHDG